MNIAPVDGVNPDLLDSVGAGPLGPPPDDGVNPYAATITDGTAPLTAGGQIVTGAVEREADGSPSPGYGSGGPRPAGEPDSALTAAGPTAADVLGVAPAAAVPIAAAAVPVAAGPAPAVDAAARATPVASVEAPERGGSAPDLVSAGLAADLGADPGPIAVEVGAALVPGVGADDPGDIGMPGLDDDFD